MSKTINLFDEAIAQLQKPDAVTMHGTVLCIKTEGYTPEQNTAINTIVRTAAQLLADVNGKRRAEVVKHDDKGEIVSRVNMHLSYEDGFIPQYQLGEIISNLRKYLREMFKVIKGFSVNAQSDDGGYWVIADNRKQLEDVYPIIRALAAANGYGDACGELQQTSLAGHNVCKFQVKRQAFNDMTQALFGHDKGI